ncbi:MAG: hypothetical protein EOQ95_21210 [Mesorhizobium sp.]|nr:MAG: hypothetical protein EOQ95_21210 [Mesorhizobium sp.]
MRVGPSGSLHEKPREARLESDFSGRGTRGPWHIGDWPNPRAFVIPVRSKERSDAAQTLGSVPLPWSAAAVQNL